MNDIFISKHDPYAYQGKMDRLTFSKQLQALQESVYDLIHETVDQPSMELVNLQITARNEVLYKVVSEIDDMVRKVMSMDEDTLAYYWNIKKESLENQYGDQSEQR